MKGMAGQMPGPTNEYLIQKAKSLVNPRKIKHGYTVADVGCALVTDSGNIYEGVSIDAPSGMGFCAEHSAIAAMLTRGENRIARIVAVSEHGVIAPCGRCREFMHQIHDGNPDADIILSETEVVKLKDLLPRPWDRR